MTVRPLEGQLSAAPLSEVCIVTLRAVLKL